MGAIVPESFQFQAWESVLWYGSCFWSGWFTGRVAGKLMFGRKPAYRRLELKFVTWHEADALIRQNSKEPPPLRWEIAPEEDHNRRIGFVYIERKERI
jgi:hypothetical protein